MLTNKISIGALTLSSVMLLSASPVYAIPTITIVTDPSVGNVVDLLRWDFENNFCTDPSNPSGEPTCDVSVETSDSATIRDEIVNSGSSGVNYDLFLSSDPDPSDLYYKYQFSHPNVVVGKPFQFASDSIILFSNHAGAFPTFDLSSGFPKHLAEELKFVMPDPVTDAYGVVSAQILTTLQNSREVISHAQTVNYALQAYGEVYDWYDPTLNTPFGFVAKSAACSSLELKDPTIYYDFSKQENLKAINNIPWTGVTISKSSTTDNKALLDSFVSYITGKINGSGSTYNAADRMKLNCLVPVAAKQETKGQQH